MARPAACVRARTWSPMWIGYITLSRRLRRSGRPRRGVHPEEKVIMETMRFNEEMMKAGVLLDAGGLWPSSQGKRIRVEGTTRQIIDGPFTETKELIGGYWMVQAKSFDEVVEWMKRCPT